MSGLTGDKSRYFRVRKGKLARRLRSEELRKKLKIQIAPPPAALPV